MVSGIFTDLATISVGFSKRCSNILEASLLKNSSPYILLLTMLCDLLFLHHVIMLAQSHITDFMLPHTGQIRADMAALFQQAHIPRPLKQWAKTSSGGQIRFHESESTFCYSVSRCTVSLECLQSLTVQMSQSHANTLLRTCQNSFSHSHFWLFRIHQVFTKQCSMLPF